MNIDEENKVLTLTRTEFEDKENWREYFGKWLIKCVHDDDPDRVVFTSGPMRCPLSFEQEELFQFINEGIDALLERSGMYGNSAMVESILITYMTFYDFALHGPWYSDDKKYNTCKKFREFSQLNGSGPLGLSSLYPDVNEFAKILKEFRELNMRG